MAEKTRKEVKWEDIKIPSRAVGIAYAMLLRLRENVKARLSK